MTEFESVITRGMTPISEERRERAVLVGVDRPGSTWPLASSLAELERLVDTAGADAVATTTQKLDAPNPRTFVGTGKAEEVAELARAQEEIKDMTFEATAGGGMVKVVANGDMTVDSIVIDPEAVDPEDVEMLQDMVAAAVNEALRGVSEISSQRLNAATGGLNIPGLM